MFFLVLVLRACSNCCVARSTVNHLGKGGYDSVPGVLLGAAAFGARLTLSFIDCAYFSTFSHFRAAKLTLLLHQLLLESWFQ
jgi:hypothetical protein